MTVEQFTDARFASTGAQVDSHVREGVRTWVESAIDRGVDTVLVVGDDFTVSAVATAYLEDLRARVEPLTLVPVGVAAVDHLAQSAGLSVGAVRKAEVIRKRLHRYSPRFIETLRVVDAMDERARLCMTFGGGDAVVESIRTHQRLRRRDLVSAMGQPPGARLELIVDWEPIESRPAVLLASTLRNTWADVRMRSDGACVRWGRSPASLVEAGLNPGRLTQRLRGRHARQFSRIHINAASDYVVDGQIVQVAGARSVSITPGPRVRILAPS